MDNQLTQEEIQKIYNACLDSVGLITNGKPEGIDDADWAQTVERNAQHLKIMLEKDFWTPEFDLAPLQQASNVVV